MHENTYAGELDAGYVKYYAELGAGVEPMARMIMENLPQHLNAFADVGCGLGYSMDFVEHALNVPALGFEPYPMSLATDLRGELLARPLDAPWLAQDARRFDLILASEVIEHVDDPVGFASQLRMALADALSLAVFSTPDADSITPHEHPSEIYSRLFPGEHRCLYTAEMLKLTLLRAGFECVEVVRHGGQLVATAGTRQALESRRCGAGVESWHVVYQRYLRDAFQRPNADPASPMLMGHAYRLFKALMNGGDFAAARAWLEECPSLRPLLDERRLLRQSTFELAISLPDFESYVTQLPSFLGPMAYHLAMLARLEGRMVDADAGLRQALRWMEREVAIGPFCFIESSSLLGPVRMERALLLVMDGKAEQAIELWQSMPQGLPDIRLFACTGARLALEFNASAQYAFVDRVFECLASHSMRSQGLLSALCDGVWDGCLAQDIDLAFDAWIARFHCALHSAKPPSEMHEAYVVLSLCVGQHPDPSRQAKLDRVREDLDATRRDMRAKALVRDASTKLPAPMVVPALVHFVDQLWCDAHGVYVSGWVHVPDKNVECIRLACRESVAELVTRSRPDVQTYFEQQRAASTMGFSGYLSCPPFQPVELQVECDEGVAVGATLALPQHLMQRDQTEFSSIACLETFRRLMKERGGTVIVLGGRKGDDHPDEWADCLEPECRVVRVDIHAGEGVDLVADAHALSEHFAPGSVDAVMSSSVMEHLEAPWVVAAQINHVLRPDGLTMHFVPHTWPLHAAPNDFWRVSESGLQALYGPSMGFEVLSSGMDQPVRMYPPPALRSSSFASIEMPLLDGYLESFLLARKVADLPEDAVRWPGSADERVARAQTYPVDE
ncbi:methyltransferase domain-containing protein [Diaphorobacter sp. HDW4B]|uniref:class I SAM-dependent methyltransferase n=1 Tax=Diaphorobacter sp. HDW4B TaxID=2714925 RepID=UPI00140B8EA2|nr:class I SAM-dependent methyltransferase [Diaphorobacter sp. HDW4B]QIL70046.1 methyltransferase domain-containing protein [Diaphorobacter sp. HDW4B]